MYSRRMIYTQEKYSSKKYIDMKKTLFILFLAIDIVANAQERIGQVSDDTTTRPRPKLAALAWKGGDLFVVKPTGNTIKLLQNDQRLFVGTNNRVGVNTKVPSTAFEVAGNAKVTGSLQIGVGTGIVRASSNGTLSAGSIQADDLPYLGSTYYDVTNPNFYNQFSMINSPTGQIDVTPWNENDVLLNIANGGFYSYGSSFNPMTQSNWTQYFSAVSAASAASTYMPFSGGTYTGDLKYSPTTSQSIESYNNSTTYQKYKWYIDGLGASSKLVLQTEKRNGAISLKNPFVIANGNVKIGGLTTDEPTKTLEVAGDATIQNSLFLPYSSIYPVGSFLKVGTNGAIEGYSGLVSNATHTGDATGATTLTLATVNANIGSFGSSTVIPAVTVNAKGLITAVSTNTIPTSNTTTLGLLSATDWNTFNAKLSTATAGSTYLPISNPTVTGTATLPIIANTSGANFATTSGNVGIGTQSPLKKTHIKDAIVALSATQLAVEGAGGGYGAGISFQSALGTSGVVAEMAKITADGESSWSSSLITTQDAGLRFFTSYQGAISEKVKINANGNIGIGVGMPTEKLQVDVANVAGTKFVKYSTAGGANTYGTVSAESGELRYNSPFSIGIAPNNTVSAFFKSDGSIGIGNISPIFKLDNQNASRFGEFYNGTTSNSALNTLNVGYANNDDVTDAWINYYGYNAGITRFRNFKIGNGKNTAILTAVGSTGNVGIGITTPTATLDINGYIKLKPLTTTEINAIASPTEGMEAYNMTLHMKVYHNGSGWKRFDGTAM